MSSQAYTPGLKRKAATIVQKSRILPISGEVLVKEGDKVSAETNVARTFIAGPVQQLDVAGMLGVDPWDVSKFMLKKKGEPVTRNEMIAAYSGFFNLIKKEVRSPIDGTVESISDVTGSVYLREPSIPQEIKAFIPGKIVKVLPREGAIVETTAAHIQGIFGIGGEVQGELELIVGSPDDVLSAKEVDSNCVGKVLVGGGISDW